jgi:hypothetical protein
MTILQTHRFEKAYIYDFDEEAIRENLDNCEAFSPEGSEYVQR